MTGRIARNQLGQPRCANGTPVFTLNHNTNSALLNDSLKGFFSRASRRELSCSLGEEQGKQEVALSIMLISWHVDCAVTIQAGGIHERDTSKASLGKNDNRQGAARHANAEL